MAKTAGAVLLLLIGNVGFAQSDLSAGMDYALGRAIFEKIWVSSPASTTASDGLGPLYSARSCAQCHNNNTVVFHLKTPTSNEHPAYGSQLQTFAVPGFPAEGIVGAHYTSISLSLSGDETVTLHQPSYQLSALRYGELASDGLAPRRAASLAGIGLLAAIPASTIAAFADEDDADGDGISGRINRVWDRTQQAYVTGRFGWKAEQTTLLEQVSRAFNQDMGISSGLYPDAYGDCTQVQEDCLSMPHGNSSQHDDLEASALMMEKLLFYVSNLPAAPAVRNDSPAFVRGEASFENIGCSGCHQPVLEGAELSIRPYSDLLLHDMGPGLADAEPSNLVGKDFDIRSEWRTPPLWGLGAQEDAKYLHDGRAQTLIEAILWHGGEAEESVSRFKSMAKMARDDLIAFLNRL